MKTILSGKAKKFGDHIDTDMIIPSRFLVTDDEKELGCHAFEDHRPGFSKTVKAGDILVAGRNFGCGSSREHAPLAIRGAGISCIIAESFARTFFRNCINRGFLALEVSEAGGKIKEGDSLSVNLEQGIIENETSGERYKFHGMPPFIREVCDGGGLYYYIQKQLQSRKEGNDRQTFLHAGEAGQKEKIR